MKKYVVTKIIEVFDTKADAEKYISEQQEPNAVFNIEVR